MAKISKFQNSKMELSISLTIPENMNALGGTIKTQWAIVSFKKIMRIVWNGFYVESRLM